MNLWAFQIALEKKWGRILVERDAKTCIDSLAPMSSKEKQVHWSISTFIRISLEISKSFLSCNFCWISRDCSGVAHVSAKLASSLRKSFSGNCPTSFLLLLIFARLIVLLLFLRKVPVMKVLIIHKKKKKRKKETMKPYKLHWYNTNKFVFC